MLRLYALLEKDDGVVKAVVRTRSLLLALVVPGLGLERLQVPTAG